MTYTSTGKLARKLLSFSGIWAYRQKRCEVWALAEGVRANNGAIVQPLNGRSAVRSCLPRNIDINSQNCIGVNSCMAMKSE